LRVAAVPLIRCVYPCFLGHHELRETAAASPILTAASMPSIEAGRRERDHWAIARHEGRTQKDGRQFFVRQRTNAYRQS